MTQFIQIQTTTDQQEAALTIAETLVDEGLAACVQIGGPLTSVYRWQGKLETAAEWCCTIKTTAELYRTVERRIKELHPYEEPESIAIEITTGSASYLAWLAAQVEPPPATT